MSEIPVINFFFPDSSTLCSIGAIVVSIAAFQTPLTIIISPKFCFLDQHCSWSLFYVGGSGVKQLSRLKSLQSVNVILICFLFLTADLFCIFPARKETMLSECVFKLSLPIGFTWISTCRTHQDYLSVG